MENRIRLINDLKSFYKELTELNIKDNFVNRDKYFELIKRVENLSESDFETEEKYNSFLKVVNKPQNKADLIFFEENFTQDNIKVGLIWITNYISNVIDWLK
jgi:hypothetical protein